MILACIVAVLLLGAITVVGRAVVERVAPAEDRPFFLAAAPLVGLATILAIVDLVSLVAPLRIGAFVVVPLVGVAIFVRPSMRIDRGDVVALALALAAGAWPIFAVGRATVVALTNDDATFYLSAADQLLAHRWIDDPFGGNGPVCLSNALLHSWMWRTGIPNLVAVVVAVSRVAPTTAVAVVTMLLLALIASSSIAIALAVGVADRSRLRSAVGTMVALSGAAVFLAWQHLLGQLFAFSFFPLGVCALAVAVDKGGVRRMVLAALLLGAGVCGFADASVALVIACLSVLAFGSRRRLLRLVGTGVLSLAMFAPTAYRAAWAAYGTVVVRPREEPQGLFPQRGWLARGPLDDLGTLFGVDPWPPWPAAWPSAATVIERVGTLAAIGLLVAFLVRRRRRRGVILFASISLATLVAVMLVIPTAYLRGKWLLLDAALAIPFVVIAAVSIDRGWARILAVPFVVANLAAVLSFSRPSSFHVVDTEAHDRLVVEIARVPPGSLLVLDGFGAPADPVHDEHRAYRAANLALIEPVQPGLDGGFYKPVCATTGPSVLPAVGWALQRAGVETLSGGEIVSRFGPFTLRRADLTREFVAAWAPTHGFLRAEIEPDGTVFRWAEATAAGTLRVFSRASCGRLTFDARTVSSEGTYALSTDERLLGQGPVTPIWTPVKTAMFSTLVPVPIALQTTATSPDSSHVLAMRRVAFVPEPSCVSTAVVAGEPATFPLETRAVSYTIAPAVGVLCGSVIASVEARSETGVVVAVGADRAYHSVPKGSSPVSSLPVDFRTVGAVSLRVVEGEPIVVTGLRVQPTPCKDPSK